MASNNLKALQLTKQLEKKAQEATQNRKLAEIEVNTAEELIKSAKKMDANVAKAEAKLTEATAALSKKEFKSALELATEAKNIAKKLQEEHVVMVIDSTKNLVDLAKGLEAKVTDLDEKLSNADSALKEGKYEEALDIAKKSWEELDKLLNEKVSNTFTKAQSMIVMAKKVKDDVSEAETFLNKAREHTEKNDYGKALDFIKQCMQITGKIAEEEISQLMENATASINLAKRMKADTKKYEGMAKEAKQALESGDYEKAINIATKNVNEIESVLERQGKNLIRDSEDGVRMAKNINAEVQKATLLLNKAREAYKSKNFEEVYDYTAQIAEEVENAQFQCVLKTISLSRPKFITAKNIGVDLSESMKFLDNARASLKEKKFTEALEYARKGEFIVNNLIGDYEGAKEELQLITQSLTRASKVGVDTTAISDMIMEAKGAFDSKDFKNAMKLIAQCREKIEKSMYDRTMEIVDSAEKVVIIGEKTASDVTKAKELIEQASMALSNNNFEKAIALARKSEKTAGESLKRGISAEINGFVDVVKKLQDGGEKSNCIKSLKGAKEAMTRGNYEEAYGCIVDCTNTIEDHIKTSFEVLDTAITTMKDMGTDVTEFSIKRDELNSLFDQRKYVDVLTLSEEMVEKINSEQQKLVVEIQDIIENDIKRAIELGIEVGEQQKRLKEAKEAIGKRFYKEAFSKLAKSREDMRVVLGKHQEFSEVITSMKTRLEEASGKGIDISSPKKKLDEAMKALQVKDFEVVSKNLKDSDIEIKQLLLVHDIKERMEFCKQSIEIAKGLEMNTSDVEMQLKKAVIYLNNGQYENALENVNETRGNAEQLCNLKLSEMLSNAYSMIIEAKKIGLDVLTVEVLYQKAEEALQLKRYERAARYASASLNEIEEIRDESQRAANIIHLAQNYIQEAESLKADVKNAKDLLSKAFSELKDNEYMSSIELGKKCIRKAKNAKQDKVTDTIASFQSIIAKAKSDGNDVSKAEELLGEAKLALQDEDYTEALRLAMLSESEVEKADLQKKMAAEIISVTAAKLKEAEKNGVEVEDVRKLLMDAANALKEKNYIKALELAMESGLELTESTDKYERASTTLAAAQARINESDEIGVDVKKAKDMLSTANDAFGKNDFTTAMKYGKETIREAKRAYVEHLSRPIHACEQLIETADNLGVKITRAKNMLSEAKTALDEESYSQVALFAENCKRLVEREITKHLFERVASAKTTMAEDRTKGVDVGEASKALKSVESSLEERKYIEAADYFQNFMTTLTGTEPGAVETEAAKPTPATKLKEEKIEVPAEEKVVEEKPIDLEKFIPAFKKRLSQIHKQGLNTRNGEKFLKQAVEAMKTAPEKALELARKAEDALETELLSFSPKISIDIDFSGVKEKDKWYDTVLVLANDGKSVARDVNIVAKGGDFSVEGLAPQKILKAKDR
ncbi:MAG: hypothetical protein JSW28_00955, partial [Thermoplasmata archaeon]